MLHKFTDPDAGDTLLVVTAPPPIRGLIKRQEFVELSLLESIHGVAVQPNSEEVTAEIGTDKIRLGRPGGLTLSSADVSAERAATAVKPLFDIAEWRKNQAAPFIARQDALMVTAASDHVGRAKAEGADGPGALLHVARHVPRSQGRRRIVVLDDPSRALRIPAR